MPRKRRVPAYCHHKASGRAVVGINGQDHYLGPFGSDESHAEYGRLIEEWRSTQQTAKRTGAEIVAMADSSITISEVILRYRNFAKSYYVKDGDQTQEFWRWATPCDQYGRCSAALWPSESNTSASRSF